LAAKGGASGQAVGDGGNREKRFIKYLLPARQILIAYDNDAPGQNGSVRLGRLSDRIKRISPPAGKDMTDSWKCGCSLRAWIDSISCM